MSVNRRQVRELWAEMRRKPRGIAAGSVLLCRFYRYAAPSDNYTGGVFALELDFHYEMDTIGSRQVTTK